jgi:oligopeptide transport system permease protein
MLDDLGYSDVDVSRDDFKFCDNGDFQERVSRPHIGYWEDAWRRLKHNKLAMWSIGVLAVLVLMSVIGPSLTGYDYADMRPADKNLLPCNEFWFGTDQLGRDIFTRIWIGGRISIVLGVVGAFIDIVIGSIYGGISGYFGGKIDNFMMRVLEILASIPYLLVVILVSMITKKGLVSLIIAMTITGWCYTARLVRGQIIQIKNRDYILAANALGTSSVKVIFKHLMPNIMGVIIVSITIDIPSFIFGEAFLSYIGLGIQSPMTSWGAMAAEGQANMNFYGYQLLFPTIMISSIMLSLQILGDGLRDALDPKLRR